MRTGKSPSSGAENASVALRLPGVTDSNVGGAGVPGLTRRRRQRGVGGAGGVRGSDRERVGRAVVKPHDRAAQAAGGRAGQAAGAGGDGVAGDGELAVRRRGTPGHGDPRRRPALRSRPWCIRGRARRQCGRRRGGRAGRRAFAALTVKVYEVPLARPFTVQVRRLDEVQLKPPGLEVAV